MRIACAFGGRPSKGAKTCARGARLTEHEKNVRRINQASIFRDIELRLLTGILSYLRRRLYFLSQSHGWARCQSAFKLDPVSASNFDPFERRVLTVALASSELAGVAETWRARAA